MRTVDLFAGCGGMTLGFKKAGFNIVAAYDNWDLALECYRKNFSHSAVKYNLQDHKAVSSEIKKFKPRMIIGGPPCQDFSHAGKRTEGAKANLTIAFSEIINNVRPSWFVMENVDRSKNSNAYKIARKTFKRAGYGLTERVLDSSLCGVPQKRKRFFCIGCLQKEDGFLDLILDSFISKKPMTLRNYFGNKLGVEYYYRHPRNYSRRAIFSIDEPSPTVRGVNRPIPKNYTEHPGDGIRLNSKIRPLTSMERAMIQTFPRKFKWTGSKTNIEQMVGNAVPVKLAELVAKVIIKYANGKKGEKL